jgi:hypothetical protein
MYLKINRQVTLSNLSVCLSILEERCFIGSRGNNQMNRREGLEREKEKLKTTFMNLFSTWCFHVFSQEREAAKLRYAGGGSHSATFAS